MQLLQFVLLASPIEQAPVHSGLEIRLENSLSKYANNPVYINGTSKDSSNNTKCAFAFKLDISKRHGNFSYQDGKSNTQHGPSYFLTIPYFASELQLIFVNTNSNQICTSNATADVQPYRSYAEFKDCVVTKPRQSDYKSYIDSEIKSNQYEVKQIT